MTWNSPQVNKTGVMKAYVDEYDNHAFGILQEDSQNGFDAYLKGTRIKDMKIKFKYDSKNQVFYYQDFNTTGMPHCLECDWGLKSDRIPCTEEACPWGCYHNLAYSGKSGSSLGSRGMGKSLRIECGEKTVINTTLPDGRYKASVWQKVDGDWKWRLSEEDSKKLSSPGTEMYTSGIIDSVHEELMNFETIINQLQLKWFKLINQGATIEYIIDDGVNKRRQIVPKLRYPEIEESTTDKPTTMKKKRIVILFKGKRVGELRNLELYLAKSPFPDEDPLHGIAIVKNGKQTITRYNQFPSDIPDNIRRRIFGYTDASCDENEPFLNAAENSTHTNYQYGHPNYKAVRMELNKILKDFAQPFIKASGERVSEKEQKEAREILEVINKTLSTLPQLQLFGLDAPGGDGEVLTSSKTTPYISRVEPANKRFNKGENVKIKATIKNPRPNEDVVNLEFNFFDPTPVVIQDINLPLLLRKGSPDDPSTQIQEWDVYIDESMIPGIYWIQVKLNDKENNPIINDKKKIEKARSSIHIEQDPPVLTRSPKTGGKPGGRGRSRGGEGEGGLSALYAIKRPDLADIEFILETARAYGYYNLSGRRVRFINERSSKKNTYWYAVAEAFAEQMIELKAEKDIEEGGEEWSATEVKDKITELEELRIKFIKTFMDMVP